jgi:hypothetical protein
MSMTRLIVKYIFIINIYRDTNIDTLKELKDVHSFFVRWDRRNWQTISLEIHQKVFFLSRYIKDHLL